MKLPEMTFRDIHWTDLPVTTIAGEVGHAQSQVAEEGELRTRLVTYEPGFVLDHFCDRGHVVYVIEGELLIDLADGREFAFPAGSGLAVSDYGDQPHRIRSERGCRVFIVD